MNIRALIGDLSIAMIAQGISVCLSVVTTLFLPKILDIEEFGYWQLFILYVGYVGIFHLGLNDGVYLLNGGKKPQDISKAEITGSLLVGVAYQSVFTIAILIIALIGPFEDKRAFVITTTAMLLLINNVALFFGYLLQAINQTKYFSISIAIDGVVLFFLIAILAIIGISSFELYIVAYLAAKTIRLLYCLIKGGGFISVHGLKLRSSILACHKALVPGFKLMSASLISSLILGVVRFFIDFGWDIETFSIVSFSLSIATFFLLFLFQISMVLFPHIKQTDTTTQQNSFKFLTTSLAIFFPALFLLYPIISQALTIWLPEYSDSIRYFIYLFPLCYFDGKMDIVGTTYFKLTRKEGLLLKINTATLTASIVFTAIGTILLHSIEFILISAITILAIRCLISVKVISNHFHSNIESVEWQSAVLCLIFVAANTILNAPFDECTYLLCYCVFLFAHRALATKQIKTFSSIRTKSKN